MYELSRPLPVNQGSLGLDDIIFITLNTLMTEFQMRYKVKLNYRL